MIHNLIALILVLFGCVVDTSAQTMGDNAIDVVTEIAPPAETWRATVIERMEILDVRQRSFSFGVRNIELVTTFSLMYSWGNVTHSIIITYVRTIPVEPLLEPVPTC